MLLFEFIKRKSVNINIKTDHKQCSFSQVPRSRLGTAISPKFVVYLMLLFEFIKRKSVNINIKTDHKQCSFSQVPKVD